MRTGQWLRGESAIALAEEWGLSVSRVEDLTSEAWRNVCREATDADAARPTIAGTLQVALAEAYVDRDYGNVARLGDTWSKVVGARAPEVRAEMPLSPEDARAKYKELTGREWGE